ncbi:hypothetical protein [Allorhodopirellula solitaria]|uniref:Transmembrane protein n=1 Tax=Allorhodopirellula solitaria TaxID=2527987 RepID=A0A5C5YHM5_9BACT|nr:hypothetical protein [Allorhodopirellula solitaria]TWT74325.1 hypothetical protein CA85_12130 [Allorhodopirellula solitaria]
MPTSTEPATRETPGPQETSTPQETSQRISPHDVVDMRPSRFDLTSGFFLTLILFLGVIVSLLFLLWTLHRWSSQSEIRHSPPVRTTFVDAGKSGSANDFDVPSEYEVQELTAPSVHESLIAATHAAGPTAASLEEIANRRENLGTSGHSGPVGAESHADASTGPGIIPRFERWQLNFAAPDRAAYAAQLDYFEMELGVLGGGIQGIDMASNLSTDPRAQRRDDTQNETRLYFMWTKPNRLSGFEHAMLEQAGIEFQGRIVVRFIPSSLENELAVVELKYAIQAGHESVADIAKTVFQSVSVADGFEFQVVDQRYR